MRFTLIVHGAHASARQFAAALLRGGHEVASVFFYHQGAMAARRDGADTAPWSELAAAHDLPLQVCVGAAQRRGLQEDDADAVDPAFDVVGLGQLAAAIATSDRVVTFGGSR